jgi:hypothetical protein
MQAFSTQMTASSPVLTRGSLIKIITEFESTGLQLTSEDGIKDFLGVTIKHHTVGTIHLTQKILSSLSCCLMSSACPFQWLPISCCLSISILLTLMTASSIIESLANYSFLRNPLILICPILSIIPHDPKVEHDHAVECIGLYLKGTADKGLVLKPESGWSLDLHVDADFSSNWDKEIATSDSATAQSTQGYILSYCGMPILCAYCLKFIIALSTTRTEYVGSSKALPNTLSVVLILQEMTDLGYPVYATKAQVYYTVFDLT